MINHMILLSHRFTGELIHTLIIVILCFLIYYKTKEMYDLSKHKGILYFRNAFLFFGLAYTTRFLSYLILISLFRLDIIPKRFLIPLFMVPLIYLSTIAIFFLAYSTFWKKIEYKKIFPYVVIIASGLALCSFIFRTPLLVVIVQAPLVLFTLFNRMKNNSKHKTHTRSIYNLIIIFWLLNIIPIGFFKLRLPIEIIITTQILSMIIFFILYYKVRKWTK